MPCEPPFSTSVELLPLQGSRQLRSPAIVVQIHSMTFVQQLQFVDGRAIWCDAEAEDHVWMQVPLTLRLLWRSGECTIFDMIIRSKLSGPWQAISCLKGLCKNAAAQFGSLPLQLDSVSIEQLLCQL